ncbi:hypothetical protein BDA99DRAFT_526606 [Phascolomyces articulosus]|uniref:Uncharacterized protein n=1 Tax=Phascolomyces articulosus TaxID=60185 RepID=A0AAD5K1P0_9FUNG|nr:hypothetical protein BDA99DRAFT_526606 [Phascolomyces articulosus]
MNVVMDTFHNFLETCSFNGSQASFLESIPSPASQDESMATSEDSSLHCKLFFLLSFCIICSLC